MELERPRLRRKHNRSRNGCLSCKQRHARCDEGKPICKSCLVRGYVCQYTIVETEGQPRQQPLRPLMPSPIDFDPFDALPIKFTKKSLEIFHHFNNFRLLAQTKAPSEYGQGILSKTAIYYHTEIAIAAMFYSWLYGSYKVVEETYIFHKLEIIRIVNESIAGSAPMTKHGVVEGINSLSLIEAGVGEISASQVHLDGLAKVYEQANPRHRQNYQTYWDLSQHLMLILGSFLAAARKAHGEDEISIVFRQRAAEDIDEMGMNGVTPAVTPAYNRHITPAVLPNTSAAWATAAYLYLTIICFGEWRPGGVGNSHLLRWLLDWVRFKPDDAYRRAIQGYSSELWLWRTAVGAYALTVIGAGSTTASVIDIDGDENGTWIEMAILVAWYKEQLSKLRQATWAPEWETTKGVFDRIEWLQIPGSLGELVLEKAWQDAVENSNGQ